MENGKWKMENGGSGALLFAFEEKPFTRGMEIIGFPFSIFHFPFVASLVLYLVFCCLTPLYYLFLHENEVAGLPYAAARGHAFGVYATGLLVFVASYWLLPKTGMNRTPTVSQPNPQGNRLDRAGWRSLNALPLPYGMALSLSAICVLAVGTNLYLSGATLPGLWAVAWGRASNMVLWGSPIAAPWLEAFTDSLITTTLLVVIARPQGNIRPALSGGMSLPPVLSIKQSIWREFAAFSISKALILALTAYYFLLTGWRYRLLLLGAARLGYGWQTAGRRQRQWLTVSLLVLLPCAAFLFHNRVAFALGQWRLLGRHTSPFSLAVLARETSTSQAFMRVLVWRDSTGTGPDYGRSTLSYLVLRPLPARFFAGGIKPLPPLQRQITAAFGASAAGRKQHPAVTNLEEYYLAAGWLGLALGMAAMAGLCRWLGALMVRAKTPASKALGWVGTAFLYQLITRGHLPQQAELAFFLFWPFAALYLYSLWRPRPAQPAPLPV